MKYVKNINGSGGDNTTLKLTVDDDYKLVVMTGTKSDGSMSFPESNLAIVSGTGTLLSRKIYRGNYSSTGYCAIFSDVKKGAVIYSGACVYGQITATLTCFK